MHELDGSDPVDDATGLGLPVLAQVVEGVADGIFLLDAAQRWVYANDAACAMLGRSVEDLIGRDYVDVVPPQHKAAVRQYYAAVLEGSTEMYAALLGGSTEMDAALLEGSTGMLTRMLVHSSGEEREMVFAPFRISVKGRTHGAALFRDFTETRAAGRAAAALAQSAAELVGQRSVSDVLAGTARHVVEGTRAFWAGLALVGESGTFDSGGAYGPGGADVGFTSEGYQSVQAAPAQRYLDAMTGGTMRIGDAPGRAKTSTRATWEQDPVLSTYGRAVLQHDWRSAVSVPLAYDDRVIGALMVLLPTGITALTDAEVAFCTAMADHAAVAVANERLSRQAARSAELRERGRVARELHDSVSQALFAMTMHARAAELLVARAGLGGGTPLAGSLEQLSQLSRGTLAEMRALIFELRPEALAEEGLVRALRTRAEAISAGRPLSISVEGPADRLPLEADVEGALYWIVATALRDLEEQARADTVAVTVHLDGQKLTVTITDEGVGDGVGDASARETGGPRLTIMAERAATIGAALEVRRGALARVSISVPLPAPADQDRAQP